MNLSFHGAARSVTGSRHMLEIPGFKLLLDCGLFQGRRDEAFRRNRDLGFDPKSIGAVLLSHAHIDHSGALPMLPQYGFSGKVYVTRASADLTTIMLEDSARVQESDCRYVNKKEQRGENTCVRPFYDGDDVRKIVRRFEGVRYRDSLKIAPRLTASFHDAGHILGSAAIRLKYTARGNTTTVLFSGDLGRSNMPILRDPEPPPPCDILILESTYGDRLHEQVGEETRKKAQELIEHARLHKSKIIVPAFAVGRTQELIMRIKELVSASRVDPIPIYIDSPLAGKATEIFRRHRECFDEETLKTFSAEGDLFASRYIHFISSPEESKRLNTTRGPMVIISSSGMRGARRASSQTCHTRPSQRDRVCRFPSGAYAGTQIGRGLGCGPYFWRADETAGANREIQRALGPCRSPRFACLCESDRSAAEYGVHRARRREASPVTRRGHPDRTSRYGHYRAPLGIDL